MNAKKTLLAMAVLGFGVLASPVVAFGAPHFTLSPASGNQTVGTNFDVMLGVDSDTEKVVGIDIKASYDTSKLEIVSVTKATDIPDTGYQFSYATGQTIIHADTGTFEVTLSPTNQSVLVGPVAKHNLLKVTFKPKATGVATLSYVCTANSVTETNIINPSGVDVVDCATNQSGSYTIGAGSGDTSGDTTVVSTPTTGVKTSSLPTTGGITDTVLLLVVGISSVGAALYFKYL